MTKFSGMAAMLLCVSFASAEITLEFPVEPLNTGATRLNAGSSLVFDFAVDGSGNVTVDATTASGDPLAIATVNGWDGVVGSVANESLFNSSFQLTASGYRLGSSNNISLDGYQGGQLGIYGRNASRIDGANYAETEELKWEITDGNPELQFTGWVYTSDNGIGDSIIADADSAITNFNLAGRLGTNTLPGITLDSGEFLSFMQPTNGSHGFGLAGFSFDLVGAPVPLQLTTGIVEVAFSNTLTNRLLDVPIRLDYSVDGSGIVSLDASTSSSDPEAIAVVDGWDGATALFTNPVVFNSTFSLTLDAITETGGGRVALAETAPGGLGIQGQNSSRIDGGGLATPNVETLRIATATGAARVGFKGVGWNNSANGVQMTASLGNHAATNAVGGVSGEWLLEGFTAASGETLALSTASAQGFALTGFSFELVVPEVQPRTNALPNIIVILADDLGYSDISHNPYSAPEVSTPNIDNLISNGVWFSDAYASGNICAPSRTGFLSGCYQHRIGVHHEGDVNASSFSATFPYFPQHLKQQFDGVEDYATQFVGKWHQGRDRTATVSVDGNNNGSFTEDEFDYGLAEEATLKYNPLKRGFDQVYGFVDLGGSSYWNYGRGFFDQLYRHEFEAPIDGIDDGDALETYMTTRFTEEACGFIETQAAADKPFFVYLSYNAVHTPMEAPSTPAGLSEGDPGWFPDAEYYNTNFPNMGQTPSYVYDNMSDADKQANRAILMAMLYHMDQGIGQVVDCLTTNGVLDNTIVVFWSDNGGSQASVAANDPLRERKHFNYEGGVRVPMTISWPDGLGAYHGTTVDAPVMSIDILPTALDAAEIEPINGFSALDGKSLLPLIRGEVDAVHDSLCWSEGVDTGEYSIRQGDWKLYIDQDVYELYHLRDDVGESNDLSLVHPERVRSMRQTFYAWMDEMTAVAGEAVDERLWSTVTPSGIPAEPAVIFQRVEAADGSFVVEYDEMAGWLTNRVFEATDSLTNGWAPVYPESLEQVDRFLDRSTFHAVFPATSSQQFFRVIAE
ncbi:Arylsulfatase [Pontiella desulfatans]|uniref:Arylsulfatase n=1 Tax=Pontiella desulfatans TaxID=2750659 RepID=A0A6C2TYW2_PONDE|nr:sulfatase-like hydrolase/transferase [Pontiella desulfatans]SPS73701.1 sulfatase S1_19 [Kiritimatiellales bacterium]VGO12807.1 Arylsulfatase [Pontiella desulfatans]